MSATETTLLAVRRLLRDFTHDAPPWRARSVRYAAVLVMLGVGLGIWRATTGEPGAGPGLDPSSWPWPTRLGISWIGGFGVGWTMRRFMKLTLLALLAAFALFYLLRYLGLDRGTWAQLQQAVRHGARVAVVRGMVDFQTHRSFLIC